MTVSECDDKEQGEVPEKRQERAKARTWKTTIRQKQISPRASGLVLENT